MNKLYTIGFTKKKAEDFFEILKSNNIEKIIDIRLNNTSQLAGFSKYPDIEFFLNEILNVKYSHDSFLSPLESTLKKYKKKQISWDSYVQEFNDTMEERKINEYILNKYSSDDNICLLCSEASPVNCHRSIVSKIFREVFDCEIIDL